MRSAARTLLLAVTLAVVAVVATSAIGAALTDRSTASSARGTKLAPTQTEEPQPSLLGAARGTVPRISAVQSVAIASREEPIVRRAEPTSIGLRTLDLRGSEEVLVWDVAYRDLCVSTHGPFPAQSCVQATVRTLIDATSGELIATSYVGAPAQPSA